MYHNVISFRIIVFFHIRVHYMAKKNPTFQHAIYSWNDLMRAALFTKVSLCAIS